MKLNNKELEELLTINEQAKTLVRRLTYCDELEKEIFNCIKNKSKLSRENIKRAHNNYLALCFFINLDYFDSEVFEKLDNYMNNEY